MTLHEMPDYELHPTPDHATQPAPPPGKPHVGVAVVAAALLLAATGVATYFAFAWRPSELAPTLSAPTPAKAPAVPLATSVAPLGGTAEPIALPPLDASDALVKQLVEHLSHSAAVTAWLMTNGLIRNFTVVVANIADGVTPARHLDALRPRLPFRAIERDGHSYVDARSYERYNAIAEAVASVEPSSVARLYATLKPRLNEAYRDLGFPHESFDGALTRAIVMLLKTPTLETPARLRPQGIGYAYLDERLEDLTDAQKQFLRMGPRNIRIIDERLRAIARALGIPSGTLPTG